MLLMMKNVVSAAGGVCRCLHEVLNDVPPEVGRVQVVAPLNRHQRTNPFQFVRVSCQHCENAP